MAPVLITLVLAVGIGLLTGGRLSGLSAMRFRLVPAALAGLLLQFLVPPGIWQQVLLFASFLLLSAFAVANIKIPGFTLILAGIVMNFLVIGVNAGMPVPRWSLERSDQIQELEFLIEHGGAKHHLATEEDTLMFLADVIPLALTDPSVRERRRRRDLCRRGLRHRRGDATQARDRDP